MPLTLSMSISDHKARHRSAATGEGGKTKRVLWRTALTEKLRGLVAQHGRKFTKIAKEFLHDMQARVQTLRTALRMSAHLQNPVCMCVCVRVRMTGPNDVEYPNHPFYVTSQYIQDKHLSTRTSIHQKKTT